MMHKHTSICVVGSLNMDLVMRTPHLPAPGETVSGGPFATHPGGKGANQAVAAARLGAAVAMVGRVGGDAFGARLRTELAEAGIDIRQVVTLPDVASGVALIAVEASGQNSIIIAPGANGALTPADVEAAGPTITAAQVLLLQLETPLPAVQRAAELAHAAGTLVLLNPAPAQPLPAELLAQVDYLIPNEQEAALLLGEAIATDADAAGAAQRLCAQTGVGGVVITLGAQGAVLAQAQTEPQFVPAHSVEVADTTAAGDAFVGAFAVALAEGRTPAEALRWGNAAGALAVTAAGAQPSLPSRNAVAALL
ncbi:MAG: ribokinase [Chloroflexaceae bacterium]